MNCLKSFCKTWNRQLKIVLSVLCASVVLEHASAQGLTEHFREYVNIIPDSRVVVNYPDALSFDKNKRTRVVFFALPNGNTIEQTAGKILMPGDDWHFDIQHIAAQTRFLRLHDKSRNYVVVYLEASMKAWTTYAARHSDSYILFPKPVDSVQSIVSILSNGKAPLKKQDVILDSHSGGGRFLFNYISGVDEIPGKIEKIAFLDSVYGFEDSLHTNKLLKWLRQSGKHKLSVISYIDTTVILNGKRIVSSTGGTGYRSNLIYTKLSQGGINFKTQKDTSFVKYDSNSGNVRIWIKENPSGQIYHTILVERNGFIQTVLSGDKKEGAGYVFWGDRSYKDFIYDSNNFSK
jgi:hypothetical protein